MISKLEEWRSWAKDIYGSPYRDGRVQCALLEACDCIEALEESLTWAQGVGDAAKNASIEDLVKQWNSLNPLTMVSHAHAAYARALIASQERVKKLEAVAVAAKNNRCCDVLSFHVQECQAVRDALKELEE